jgi:DNA-binding transcriptional MocR family regulator
MNASVTEITLVEIDSLAKQYAKARAVVSERVNELEAEVATLQRRRIGGIKVAAAEAADIAAKLRALVEQAAHLFVKPKTMTLHGITVGFRKGAGKVEWEDDAKVVSLIRKHLPEQADVLIITEEKPSADAMKNLDARELAKIGARMEGTGEFVVVKSADSAVDKLVAKILKEGATAAEPNQ